MLVMQEVENVIKIKKKIEGNETEEVNSVLPYNFFLISLINKIILFV